METNQIKINGTEVCAINNWGDYIFNSNYYGCLCIAELQDRSYDAIESGKLSYKLFVGSHHTTGSPRMCDGKVITAVKKFIRKEINTEDAPKLEIGFEVEKKDLANVDINVSYTF